MTDEGKEKGHYTDGTFPGRLEERERRRGVLPFALRGSAVTRGERGSATLILPPFNQKDKADSAPGPVRLS